MCMDAKALARLRGSDKYQNLISHAKNVTVRNEKIQSGKSATIRESNHDSGVCKEHYAYM